MTDLQTATNLFNANLRTDTDWSPYRRMVANVFLAYHSRALTIEQIEGVARLIDGLPADANLNDAIRFFIRRKVLRRRVSQGKKFIEINY